MNLTVSVLRTALPKAPLSWLEAIATELPKHGFDTPNEIASFLAQCAHESKEFTDLEENLNYSAERLMVVWPKRFPSYEIAQRYEHVPERLANYVYANRNGNGDEASGDGWRFRGRGPIQLTGRRNYAACGADIGEGLLVVPDLLLTPMVGIRSALWFWKITNLDKLDDDRDVKVETLRINGGETGLDHRQHLFNHILRYLEVA